MATIPVVGGSIGYTAPTFTYGQTSQAVNGGYSFDLPLATVAAFTNNAMAFSQQNTRNAQGFFSGVFASGQSGVSAATNRAFEFQGQTLSAVTQLRNKELDVQRYGIKKKYGGGCFITTAVCKQQGLSDNCWQLMALRKFRDEQLLKNAKGKRLVQRYYREAPGIVEAIDKRRDAPAIYNYLSSHYIDRALQQISVGNFKGATDTYTALFHRAKAFAQGE